MCVCVYCVKCLFHVLYLTHARLPIDPFLVPSGGRTAVQLPLFLTAR